MEFIGQYLKNIRLKEKIKLKSVADELKISIHILQEIEKDHFPDYLNNVFIIGHIRSYAKYLGLDHNEIIKNFRIQNSYDSSEKNEIAKPINTIKVFSFSRALAYFSVIVFASGFYFLFINTNDLNNEYAMTPDLPENLIYKLEESEMEIALSDTYNKKKDDLLITQQKIISDNQSDTFVSPSSVIASTSKNQELKEIGKNISLKFLDATWIQLRDEKDDIVFSKLMNQGDEYFYKTSDNFTLTAGNAGNIIILLNNIVLGKAGKAGEVVDSLIVNKNFNQ